MLRETECWVVKSQQENKINVAKMRMCWMSGQIYQDRIMNECIRETVGVTPIVENLVDSCFRCFGHA